MGTVEYLEVLALEGVDPQAGAEMYRQIHFPRS
jgi:hypothetical protein